MSYQYESVVWVSKSPIVWDKLAQMQENMDYLKAQIDGTNAYVANTAKGFGKGIVHFQSITRQYNLPANQVVGIGSSFTPTTESGRRYRFAAYCPRYHVVATDGNHGGAGVLQLMRNGALLHQSVCSVGGSGNGQAALCELYFTPGSSTTTAYSFQTLAYLAAGGTWFSSFDSQGYILFEDIGPA